MNYCTLDSIVRPRLRTQSVLELSILRLQTQRNRFRDYLKQVLVGRLGDREEKKKIQINIMLYQVVKLDRFNYHIIITDVFIRIFLRLLLLSPWKSLRHYERSETSKKII